MAFIMNFPSFLQPGLAWQLLSWKQQLPVAKRSVPASAQIHYTPVLVDAASICCAKQTPTLLMCLTG